MSNDTDAVGTRSEPDATVEVISSADRYMARIEGDTITLDKEIVIESDDAGGFTMSAPWSDGRWMTEPGSRVLREGLPDVNLNDVMAEALRSGRRVLTLSEFPA